MVFLLNPYKVEVMINSLMEILELLDFGHMINTTV